MVYQHRGAAVTNVVSPSERGFLVPLPPAKHGYVMMFFKKNVWNQHSRPTILMDKHLSTQMNNE